MTIRVPIQAHDDPEARQRAYAALTVLEKGEIWTRELKLQEVFENLPPRGVSFSEPEKT